MSTWVAASSQLFRSLATLVIMKARPRLDEDKLDELVELFSEHIKFPTSIVYSEKMDEAKIHQKRLKENGLLLERKCAACKEIYRYPQLSSRMLRNRRPNANIRLGS